MAKCTRCEGCGKLADTDEQEPWTAWAKLPLQSSMAVLSGLVKPVLCMVCNGTGRVEKTLIPEEEDGSDDLLRYCMDLTQAVHKRSDGKGEAKR